MASISSGNEPIAWFALAADGRVEWATPSGSSPEGWIRLLRGTRLLQFECVWRLDANATPGVHDLGTLVVQQPPVVVAGEVEVGTRPWRGPPLWIDTEVPDGQGGWKWLEKIEVFPDADPAFAVRESTDAGRVRVTVRAGRHVLSPEPVVVDVGARDVRLEVDRGHRLRARVLAAPAYARAVTCRAVREDGTELPAVAPRWAGDDEEPPRSEGRLVDFDGSAAEFLWSAMPAGSYRVEVRAPGITEPLVTLRNVRLGQGIDPDPRLDPIDTRESARTLTVRVDPVPTGPRPITDGGVLAVPSGRRHEALHGLLFDPRGEARLLVGHGPVDLLVAVPGFRLWRAESVTDTRVRVELQPCLEVPIRLSPRLAERFADYTFHVRLDAKYDRESPSVRFLRPGDRDPTVDGSLAWLQRLVVGGRATIEDGKARVPISAPGEFKVGLALEGPTRTVVVMESLTSGRYNPIEPSVITVSGDTDPPVVIDVPDDILDKALKALSHSR
jgi:hypothetical protein